MDDDDIIREVARRRRERTEGSPRSTRYVEDSEEKGVAGELALADFFGVDHVPRGDGPDGCTDLILRFETSAGPRPFKMDAKCAAKPKFLWVETPGQGRLRDEYADIYVLARYHAETRRATCIAWQWGSIVRAAPITFYGKWHHEIPREELRDMSELARRFVR